MERKRNLIAEALENSVKMEGSVLFRKMKKSRLWRYCLSLLPLHLIKESQCGKEP